MKWKILKETSKFKYLLWHSLSEKIVIQILIHSHFGTDDFFKIVFIHPLIYLTISEYSFIHHSKILVVLSHPARERGPRIMKLWPTSS